MDLASIKDKLRDKQDMLLRTFILRVTYLGVILSSTHLYASTLEEATYTAINNSPTVRQAIAKFREESQNTEISRHNGFYPSIDLAAGVGKETTYADVSNSDDITLTRRELSLSLTQPIFNGFATTYDIKRLSNEAEADRWSALVSVENTALSVAQVYANVLRYRELVDLADLNLETHKRIYSQIKLKSDTGVGRKSDLSQITARLAKAYANSYAAINNLRDAESNYKNTVGQLPPKDMIYPVPDKSLLPKSLDDAIAQALAKNPTIEGSKWDVEATENYKKSIEGAKYPTVNFVVERTWNNNVDGTTGRDADLQAMFRLNYNLYNGGNYKRNKEVAVQQQVQASEIRRKTIRDTELSTRLAWAAYEATTGQKEHIKQYVVATKESEVAYEKQFRLGRRTLLDVLDSENELFQARQDYVNADYDELFSEFRLFNAKGDLMRAFRIYRPPLLGFKDEFDAKQPAPTGASPIEKLKAAEKEAQKSSTVMVKEQDTVKQSTTQKTDEKALEKELFLDSDKQSGGWQ